MNYRRFFSHPVTLRTRRVVRTIVVIMSVIIAVALVTSISVDLGPVARKEAESQLSKLIKRPSHIGRLKIYLWRGQYAVENLVIEGLTPQSRPFLVAKEITVSMPWDTLFDRRIVLDTITMRGWNMYVEVTKDGHNFPSFPKGRKGAKSSWTTTLQYVHAFDGEFAFEDHTVPWGVVARNLDVTVARPAEEYRGQAKFSKGTVSFQQYVPFRVDMDSTFKIEDGLVKFDRLDLDSEGARSKLTGVVDLGNWPEQTYQVNSHIDFAKQKAIWFAHDTFDVSGLGDFTGSFHMFKEQMPDGHNRTGRELKGKFVSPLAGLNAWRFRNMRFANLRGSVLWVPERLEITNATTSTYGGQAQFDYKMGPFSTPGVKAIATFDARFKDFDLTTMSDAFGFEGIRLAGRISGHNLLQWPLGGWSQHHGAGEIHGLPPEGRELMTRRMPVEQIEARAARGKPYGPFTAHLPIEPVPMGGDLVYAFGPEWVDVAPSRIATPDTYVELQGRTAYGDRSQIDFHVSSADWQESDRVFAGVLTAFGSRSSAIDIGGYGTFDGVMLNSFRDPRIEGRFSAERMRAFDVVWGSVRGAAAIENSYADVKNVVIRSGDSSIDADGRFSLGFPRRDNGEELNARVRITSWPVVDLRHAFTLDEYALDGVLTGEFHVFGNYQMPLGFGTMSIAKGVAYGEPFDTAETSVRMEGDGVRLDNLQIAKSMGRANGAAFVGWNGSYSFVLNARGIPLESIGATKSAPLPLTGLIDFNADGSGSFDAPRYQVKATVRDLFAADEGIGEVVGTISVSNRLMTINADAASRRLAVSLHGQIEMTPNLDTEMTLTVTDTSLDPYVRAFQPALSPFTTAVASGSVHIVGELADIDHLLVDARVDKLDARLFDYQIRNDTPIRIALDRHTLRIAEMRLVGEGTQLDVSGTVALHDQRIAIRANGDANMAVLQGFMSNVRSSGHAVLSASLQGPLSDPAVSGTLALDNARIRHFALPHALESINGTIEFDSRGLTLDGLTARLGGGTVQFAGRIDKQGYRPGRLDVTMTGQNMRLRFAEGMRATVDATLMVQGTATNAILSGDVYISDGLYTKGFDTGGGLLDVTGASTGGDGGIGGGQGETLPLRYDVRITAPSTLRVRNNNMRLLASADLELRGSYDRPLIFGRAEVNSGDIVFEGKRYVVTRGTIDFNNPTRIEPFFDVEAQARVRVPGETYIVTVRASGSTADRFAIDLSADPPLPQAEILALLFSDVPPGQDVELRQYSTAITPQQQLLRERAARLITGTVSSEVGKAVEQTFGLDTVQITPSLVDPNAQSSRLDPGARLTIGKRLSDRAYLTYARSLTSSTRDEIVMLEYDQTDRFSWILSRNEDRTYALEVRVRHVF